MEEKCNDPNCPNHGSLSLRGRTFTGVIVGDRMQKTATVEWTWKRYVTKYERYKSMMTRIKAHNPDCISAKKGEIVRIMECKPISKTKTFAIIEKIGKERLFVEREEMMEEAKVKKKKKEEEKEEEKQK